MKYQWHDIRKKQRNQEKKEFLIRTGIVPVYDAADIQQGFAEYQRRAVKMLGDIHEVMSPDDISFMRGVAESIASLDLGAANEFGTVTLFRSASARYNEAAKNWFIGDYSHGGMIARLIFGQ